MGEYICNATLRFSGKDYAIGDVVPDGIVMPKRARALIASGHLTELQTPGETESLKTDSKGLSGGTLINIPINTEEGLISLILSPQAVVSALSIVQLTVDAAVAEIRKVTDDDILILLHAIDRRKGVLKVLEEQPAVLTAQTGGDTDGTNV